jgi:HEAT repeat protein
MKLIAALLALTLVTTFCRADEVSDLVTQIPVRDSAAEDALAAKLMKGGTPAVKELAGMLVPLGTQGKDDTKVRDAFSALVRHAGHSESDRAALVKGICEGIESASDPEVKTFLVNRLQTVGHDDAVPTLAPLLADEKLGLHACMALERIGSAAAIDEIARALPQAKGALRVAMIKSLGSLGATKAAEEIRKSAADENPDVQMAALWALANIGDAAVQDLLETAIQGTHREYEKSKFYDWILLDARQMAAAGKKTDGAAICTKLLLAQGPVNVRSGAAWSLTKIDGEGALETLLPLIEKDTNLQFQAAALNALAKTPGEHVTPALAGRLKASGEAAFKAEVLNALAKRGDSAARPAVADATKDADPAVRIAALHALVALGRDEAIAALIERVTSDADAAVAKQAADMLARIPGDKPMAAAAAALDKAPAKPRVTLLELLASRAARAESAAVVKQASDNQPEVRLAALRAADKVATPNDAAKLIEIAMATKDRGEESAALKAAASASARLGDVEGRTTPWVAALKEAQGAKRAALEGGVARVGGSAALSIVEADLKSSDPATQKGALEALADWNDSSAVAPLLQAAKGGDATQQVTAIRGVVQVLKNDTTASRAEKVAAYGQALSIATRPEEKKMILGALGNEHGQEAFDLAVTTQGRAGVEAESALAVIKTALPQGKGEPGLKGPRVAEALRKAIPNCPDGGLKADAQRYLKGLK